jgi:hypothetical protein
VAGTALAATATPPSARTSTVDSSQSPTRRGPSPRPPCRRPNSAVFFPADRATHELHRRDKSGPLEFLTGGGHRGYAGRGDGSGLAVACCCSHSIGGR